MGLAMAMMPLIGAVAGAGVSAYSSIQQGRAQKRAYEAQAVQLKQQAETNRAQAAISQIQGEQEAQRRLAILSQDIGSIYAGYASNGVSLGSGTVGKALTTAATEAYADVKTIEDNARMTSWTQMNNRRQALNQSAIAQMNASNSTTATVISTVGSGFSGGKLGYGIGTAADTWWNS